MKPTRMAIRMSGVKAEESLIAAWFASRYCSDASVTRSTSRASALNALIVVMPPMLLASWALIAAASSRTAAYRGSIFFWNRSEPHRMTGTGRNASHAIDGAIAKAGNNGNSYP